MSENVGNNQRNIVEPVYPEPVIGSGAPNLNLMYRGRNRSASQGVNITKQFITKISLFISFFHLILISTMSFAYLNDFIELDMTDKAQMSMYNVQNDKVLNISKSEL